MYASKAQRTAHPFPQRRLGGRHRGRGGGGHGEGKKVQVSADLLVIYSGFIGI